MGIYTLKKEDISPLLKGLTVYGTGGGGEPTPEGTITGVFIITMLTNGMTMLGMQYYFQYITKGVIVILAVMMSIALGKKSK